METVFASKYHLRFQQMFITFVVYICLRLHKNNQKGVIMDNWIDNLRRIGLKRYGDENRRILSELLRNGIPAGNTVMSEASAEALIIAVAAMIEENNKALLSDLSSM